MRYSLLDTVSESRFEQWVQAGHAGLPPAVSSSECTHPSIHLLLAEPRMPPEGREGASADTPPLCRLAGGMGMAEAALN